MGTNIYPYRQTDIQIYGQIVFFSLPECQCKNNNIRKYFLCKSDVSSLAVLVPQLPPENPGLMYMSQKNSHKNRRLSLSYFLPLSLPLSLCLPFFSSLSHSISFSLLSSPLSSHISQLKYQWIILCLCACTQRIWAGQLPLPNAIAQLPVQPGRNCVSREESASEQVSAVAVC